MSRECIKIDALICGRTGRGNLGAVCQPIDGNFLVDEPNISAVMTRIQFELRMRQYGSIRLIDILAIKVTKNRLQTIRSSGIVYQDRYSILGK